MNIANKKTSIVMEKWVPKLDVVFKKVDQDKWLSFTKIKNEVYGSLEKLRVDKTINKNNQAFATITFNNKYQFIDKDLAKYLNIAKVKIIQADNDTIKVTTGDAKLIKCERCWNYYEQDEMCDGEICKRCEKVIDSETN
jgi:isoleucyl-tRNA synthetase